MTREEAIQILEQRLSTAKYLDYGYIDCVDAEALEMAIEALKQSERKNGKWIEYEDDDVISGACSCCGWNALLFETDVVGMPFCPSCGAEMEEEE